MPVNVASDQPDRRSRSEVDSKVAAQSASSTRRRVREWTSREVAQVAAEVRVDRNPACLAALRRLHFARLAVDRLVDLDDSVLLLRCAGKGRSRSRRTARRNESRCAR
jgi:hypothetical protein